MCCLYEEPSELATNTLVRQMAQTNTAILRSLNAVQHRLEAMTDVRKETITDGRKEKASNHFEDFHEEEFERDRRQGERPSWYFKNQMQNMLVDQYQKSKELMDSYKLENQFLNNMKQINNYGRF
jgi:hypothetical protein